MIPRVQPGESAILCSPVPSNFASEERSLSRWAIQRGKHAEPCRDASPKKVSTARLVTRDVGEIAAWARNEANERSGNSSRLPKHGAGIAGCSSGEVGMDGSTD